MSSRGIVLVITCEQDATSNLVITALNERGATVARVDPADIGPDLSFSAQIGAGLHHWAGRLRTPSRDVPLGDVRAIYHRRPSLWRFDELDAQAREFAKGEARQGFRGLLANLAGCRYVNHPNANERAEVKPAQLQVAAQLGLHVPSTIITNDLEAARKFAVDHTSIIYKAFKWVPPAADGEVSAIWAQPVKADDLDASIAITAHMFQTEIRKQSDARVTMVGSRVFASEITSPEGALDWRSGNWGALEHSPIQVPSSTVSAMRAYLDHFGLAFGCFDFALERTGHNGSPYRWVFLECNPNGQWGWLPDRDAIADAFAETLLEGWFT